MNLEEAIALLEAALTTEEKDAWTSMTAARMFDLQARIARQLRSDWSLTDPDMPIRIFFRHLGLDDAKEVSLLLIDAYWRRRNQQEISVEDMVKEYLEEY